MSKIKEVLIDKLNGSFWWHVPPVDPNAYKKRGKFLSSTYTQAENYGRPNIDPEKVSISRPVYGFTEKEILRQLFANRSKSLFKIVDRLNESDESSSYRKRIALDAKMYKRAKKMGYDAIVLLTPVSRKALEKNRKPNSIELNLLNV